MATVERFLLAIAVAAAAAVFSTASGASYTVGEPAGSWDLQTNYTAWASSITFRLGDQLVFKYSPAAHDMLEVTKDDYDSCSRFSPVSAHRFGQDAVKLDRSRTRYFICSVQGHCASGMKLQVRVTPPGCDSPSPAGDVNITSGTPGTNSTPGGVVFCPGGEDGSPTIIGSPGVVDISPLQFGAGVVDISPLQFERCTCHGYYSSVARYYSLVYLMLAATAQILLYQIS